MLTIPRFALLLSLLVGCAQAASPNDATDPSAPPAYTDSGTESTPDSSTYDAGETYAPPATDPNTPAQDPGYIPPATTPTTPVDTDAGTGSSAASNPVSDIFNQLLNALTGKTSLGGNPNATTADASVGP